MKRHIYSIQLGLVSLMLGVISCVVKAESQRLLIGSAFRAPYIEPPNGGTVWSLLKQVESELDVEFVFADVPAARALMLANKGVLDGDVMRVEEIREDHPNLVRVPTVVSVNEIAVFSWNPELKINSFEEIAAAQKLAVATLIGRKFIQRNLPNKNNRIFLEGIELLFALLEHKRVELVVLDRRSAYHAVWDDLGKTVFEISEQPLATRHYYLYLHQRHTELVPRLNTALEEAMRQRTLETNKNPH